MKNLLIALACSLMLLTLAPAQAAFTSPNDSVVALAPLVENPGQSRNDADGYADFCDYDSWDFGSFDSGSYEYDAYECIDPELITTTVFRPNGDQDGWLDFTCNESK